ncbi:energy transducer TonB [Dyella solisilvae]|uniref:Energy transducer TonB n=1 Tax=Dyella solisilvae TaxID=1920168 RepID=A0A370K3T9_9GAMM|nr:energy transducer TonB [Dyella solisilvae]RDI97311.1 energy transducer TonB [Dyella solisilvae]
MKRVVVVLMFGWLLVGATHALAATGEKTEEDVRKTAQGAMLVTGTIEVNPDGTLRNYTLDHPEKLKPVVVAVIGKALSSWRFNMSAPTTEVVKTQMSLRMVATPMGDGKYKVAVEGASFGDSGTTGYQVSYKEHKWQPKYPNEAISAFVSGKVYLMVRIGRDGTVQEAIAEQVNLDQYGTEADMDRFRKVLADASLLAARHWTFNIPTRGPDVDDPYFVARIPCTFTLQAPGLPKPKGYGEWQTYIPGPRQTPPWSGKALANQSPDAVSGDGLQTGDSRLQLVTPVGGA